MNNHANNYGQMAGVIDYLSQHYTEQPSLDVLARVAGLSTHHFQRKFTSWAGVSPKSFIQFLTFENAKQLLNEGSNVLDAAYGVGLSSASRLHDLCVNLEAASPGEIKSGGEGLALNYGFGPSPFGQCLVVSSARGITHLTFVDSRSQDQAISDFQSQWPKANIEHNDHTAIDNIQRIFSHDKNLRQPALRAYVKGTKFQLRVWSALLNIAPGKLISYGQLAKSIGQSTATRAVGTAVGKNPLAYLIPCHRVIRGTGVMGNYRWGSGRKRIMIAYELIR
jgi:AraC family transcriptional regulator, regulatory protein of adaptative response / methylated-DNA-[protein]-cysteine methyltransferase